MVHAHDVTANIALFERVADSLTPGGRIAVLDQWAGSNRSNIGRAGLAFVGLTYHTTLGATVYPQEAVTSWLETAGFTDIDRSPVGPVAGQAVIHTTKPPATTG